MKRLLVGLTGLGLVASSLLLAGPPASATTTWSYPGVTFTIDDGFGHIAKVDVKNLVIGDTTSGYVVVQTTYPRDYTCSTQVFSGSSAQFVPDSIAPCTGTVTFTPDPTTGVLSASASLSVSSTFFGGALSGSASPLPPSVVPLTNCTVAYDAAGPALDVMWDQNPDANSYDIAVSGSGSFNHPTSTSNQGNGLGQIEVLLADLTSLSITPGTDPRFRVTITGKRSDGATVGDCTTADVAVPGPSAPTIDGKPVAVSAGGLLTVNYSLAGPNFVQGIEYRLDNGPWLRPGGQAPVGGIGGAFTLSGITAKQVVLTLRTVTTDPRVVIEGTPTTVTFPAVPASKPSAASGVAAPVSTVPGTSNGAGTGTNGALAASTGDPGVDAPCLAEDGTLYPNQNSTVGSQLTMAPNTHGMGAATSFSVIGGALPPGMQLDRTYGVLFGVTTSPGSWTTTVKATFADGKTRTSSFQTRVDADPQTLQYAARNIGAVGTRMVIAPTTNAPATGTTYTLVCGVLPEGMQLNAATGAVTGTPTKTVSMPTPLRIAESSSAGRAAASFILVVNAKGAASVSYPAHPHARAKKRTAIRPTITGQFTQFRVSRGKLPAGLKLNARTGAITGRARHSSRTHTITIVGVTPSGALVTAAPVRIKVTH